MDTLKAKLLIDGKIELLTGMHIGGSSTALDIGGIDSNVIKTAEGVPYIPGSSLKGKMRNLTGKKRGCDDLLAEQLESHADIALIFGLAGNKTKEGFATRLIVRDSFLDIEDFNEKRSELFRELELQYSESKWENTIDRTTGATIKGGLRQLERVPAGAVFHFSMTYSIFTINDLNNIQIIIEALRLLQDDYLGGSGSRGYGQVLFKEIEFNLKTPQKYESDNARIQIAKWQTLDQDIDPLLKEIKKHGLPEAADEVN